MLRVSRRSVMGAAGLAFLLAGCSTAPTMERLPESLGGLPANAPARPATPHEYPAVHDMPPPRADKPMTDEEQLKTEKALTSARDHLEGTRKAGDDDDDASKENKPAKPKKGAPAVKKKPAASKDSGTSGTDAGAKTNP
jgi:hypothetical protein